MSLTSSPESPPAVCVSPGEDYLGVHLSRAGTAEWKTGASWWHQAPAGSFLKLPSILPAIEGRHIDTGLKSMQMHQFSLTVIFHDKWFFKYSICACYFLSLFVFLSDNVCEGNDCPTWLFTFSKDERLYDNSSAVLISGCPLLVLPRYELCLCSWVGENEAQPIN